MSVIVERGEKWLVFSRPALMAFFAQIQCPVDIWPLITISL